jgi:Chromo (CHRromatin Organisation MOdifier) domain
VERIEDSRVQRGRLQYLVKWKGYPPSDNTWEAATDLRNAPELVDEFHQDHPTAPDLRSSGRRPLKGG